MTVRSRGQIELERNEPGSDSLTDSGIGIRHGIQLLTTESGVLGNVDQDCFLLRSGTVLRSGEIR